MQGRAHLLHFACRATPALSRRARCRQASLKSNSYGQAALSSLLGSPVPARQDVPLNPSMSPGTFLALWSSYQWSSWAPNQLAQVGDRHRPELAAGDKLLLLEALDACLGVRSEAGAGAQFLSKPSPAPMLTLRRMGMLKNRSCTVMVVPGRAAQGWGPAASITPSLRAWRSQGGIACSAETAHTG